MNCQRTGKHCHSEGAAEAQLRSILRTNPSYNGRVYFCRWCGKHHVGRNSPYNKNKYRRG